MRWASAAFLMLSEVCNCFQLLRDLPSKKNVSQLYREHLWETWILLDTEPCRLSHRLITSLATRQPLPTSNIWAASPPHPPHPVFLHVAALSLFVCKAAAGLSVCSVVAPMATNSKPEEHNSESSCWNVSPGYHSPVFKIKQPSVINQTDQLLLLQKSFALKRPLKASMCSIKQSSKTGSEKLKSN